MTDLTTAQYDVLWRWVLGGVGAVKRHSTRSVDVLLTKGYIDQNGPTDKGWEYVQSYEQAQFIVKD